MGGWKRVTVASKDSNQSISQNFKPDNQLWEDEASCNSYWEFLCCFFDSLCHNSLYKFLKSYCQLDWCYQDCASYLVAGQHTDSQCSESCQCWVWGWWWWWGQCCPPPACCCCRPPPPLQVTPRPGGDTWASRWGWRPWTWWGTPPGTHHQPLT